MKLDNTLFWQDAGGCHWCGWKTDSMTEGHDGMCPVPLLVLFEKRVAQLEADIGECSVCGHSPALLVDRKHKGTYWLCGDCMGKKIIEKIELEAENERLQEKAYYEDDEGKGYCYKDMCDQFKAENERLHRKIDRAYWEGHTSGRIWGRKGVSRKEIQRAESWIDALKGDD